MSRFLGSFGLVACALLGVSAASAQNITIPVGNDSEVDWVSNPVQTVGDKEFTFISSTGLGSAVTAEFDQVTSLIYNFQLHELNNAPATGDFELRFKVKVLDLDKVLEQADLGSIKVLNNTSVVATLFPDSTFTTPFLTLTNTNGVDLGVFSYPDIKEMWVKIVGDVDEIGRYSDVSLELFQATPQSSVPEPSTFVLAGLGLIGLGLVAWRRRRSG